MRKAESDTIPRTLMELRERMRKLIADLREDCDFSDADISILKHIDNAISNYSPESMKHV